MATNITPEQRDGILKVIVGLFDAAPGGIYLNQFAADVQNGTTDLQLANALANDPAFLNGILGGKVTSADKVDVLMKHYGLTADSNAASAGSQAKAYFESKLAAGQSMGQIVVDAGNYLSGTVASEFQTTKNLFLNKVAVAAKFSLNSNATDLSSLQNALSQVKGDHAYTDAEAQKIANDASANNLVLTTAATDIIKGTAGNDIVSGDPATTMQAGDQVDGGSGFDTLKVLGTLTGAANLPGVITGIETLQIAKLGAAALDLSAYTKATTGLTTIEVSDAALFNNTITTTAGQSLSLATAGGVATAGAVTWAGSATDTSLNLTLNGYQGKAAVPANLTVTGAAATALHIHSIGADNKIGTLTGPATATSHVITGDKAFSYATSALTLDKIDASAATADVKVDTSAALTKAGFAFTGGSGNDTIKLINDAFGTLTAGTQLDGGAGTDKLGILDTALTASEAAKINAAKNFESLSLNAGITVDASAVSNFKTFDVDTIAASTISNMATGTTVNVGVGATAAFVQAGLTVAGAVGITDVTVNLGGASDTFAHTITDLGVTGLTNVKISSNGTVANVITLLDNSDNSTITLTGAADLTMAINAAAATGSQIDASGMTGKATLTGSDAGDIIKGGGKDDTLTGGKGSDVMTGGAGADKFSFGSAAAAATSGAVLGNFDKITDFVAGTDKLQFSTVDVVSGQQTAVQSAVTALAAGSTAAQIATAMATANTTNLGVSFAVYEGNTYVYYETTGVGTGVPADDVFIQLTGVTTLPTFAADVVA